MDLDLLSNLPDGVLCHILSFLTTKEAALTSILSKRWRNLFAFVPNLNFDDSVFLYPEKGKREREGILQSFMGFVDRVLALQGDSPIKKLSLKCKTGVDQVRINSWICDSLRRGVSDLDLDISIFVDEEDDDDEDYYYLPEELFVSKTLVNLKFTSEFDVYWWVGCEEIFMPKLKSLCISSARVYFDDEIELLLPCFPVLEELQLASMSWKDSGENVSSATLRKLIIGGYCLKNSESISFDTPSLRSLTYFDVVAEDYPLVNMGNLVEARIVLVVNEDQIKRIRAQDNDFLEDDVVLKFGNVVKLMNGIRNVQELHLSPNTLEVLSLCCESMPVFNKVKSLVIYSDESRGWQAVPVLLRNCPHLEILFIEGLMHYVTDKCGDACDCIYRKDKGRSLKSCPVKLIKIQGFRGTMKEMNMIEHFLEYFPCVKDMEIYIEENGPTELRKDIRLSQLIVEMIEEYKDLYNCNVQVLISECLSEKWIEEWEKQETLWFSHSVLGKIMPPPTF